MRTQISAPCLCAKSRLDVRWFARAAAQGKTVNWCNISITLIDLVRSFLGVCYASVESSDSSTRKFLT
jgi:hypothetical protein